jgi:hypothetical protein
MRQGRHEALALAAAAAAALAIVALLSARRRQPRPVFDYSDRSGFPRPPEEMRGIAARPISSSSVSRPSPQAA